MPDLVLGRAPRHLRRAWAICLACLLLLVSDPGAVTVGSGQGISCASFSYQEDAQAVLDAGAGDRLGLDPDGDGIACDDLPTRSGETPAAIPSPTATPKTTFADPIATDVDGFWRRTFKRADRSYASPVALVASDGQTPTPCGMLNPFPALYCPSDGSIYYDVAVFAGLDDGYGPAAWVMTISHEWGHRAQDVLGLLDEYHGSADPTAFSMALEIQAQCAAGAYVRDALRRDVLRQIEADRVDLVAHTVLGDSIHGTSTLNVDAYERGRTKGLRACGYEF